MSTDSLTKTYTLISRTLSCFSRHLSHQNDLITACVYINYAYAASYIKQVVKDTCGWYNYHNDLLLFCYTQAKTNEERMQIKDEYEELQVSLYITTAYYLYLIGLVVVCIASSD